MYLCFVSILIGLVPAILAHSKGKSFILWWIYGALLFIVALPHALIIKPDRKAIERKQLADGMKKCPYCAEIIKNEAVVCRYCHGDLTVTSNERKDERLLIGSGNHYCGLCHHYKYHFIGGYKCDILDRRVEINQVCNKWVHVTEKV